MNVKLSLFFLFSFSFSVLAQPNFDANQKAQGVLSHFKNREFAKVNPLLDYEMRRVLGENGLEELWDALQMQFGEVLKVYESEGELVDTLWVTRTKVDFEKKSWMLKIVFNLQEKISGLFIEPLKMPYQPPSYADESLFYEYKKTLPDPKFPVEGLLTIPKKIAKQIPVVIIVAGSGPNDKDLTIGSKRIYKDIAWGLASKKIAVFRFDKRTLTHGKAMLGNTNFTIDDEYTKDVQLAVKLLQMQAEIDPNQIYVLGHSLGGHLLPYFASKIKGIRGFIGFGANYSGLPELMAYQADFLSKDLPKEQQRPYQMLKQKALYAKDRFSPNSPDDSLPDGLTAKYLLSLTHAGPQNYLKSISKKPFLLIQGEKDYQVPTSELLKWQKAFYTIKHAEVSYITLENINHIGAEELGKMSPASYEKPGNVSPLLINEVANFVRRKSKATN
ncbi:MAG: alpha/beta hydrolase [Bacteroidia bacterium]|nr:alpha/beta hydrolase [Bacteroidia bacterium]